jgi:hypothetical protein
LIVGEVVTDEAVMEVMVPLGNTAALAETAEIPPIANAAAATSATRLKLVFEDIVFLSRKVEFGTFPISARPEEFLPLITR